MEDIVQKISLMLVPILFSLTFHEVSHGMAAHWLGDDTAKWMGRLTMNPLKHLDPVGTIMIIFTAISGFGIGWAKPVPVNPANFRNPKRDMAIVAFAGPLSNLFLALIAAFGMNADMSFLPPAIRIPLAYMLKFAFLINIGLAVFNLIPIPPLDGGRILFGILPHNMAYQFARIEPYGFIILILLLMTNVIDLFLYPFMNLLASGIAAIVKLI